MKKELNLLNLYRDLGYLIEGNFVQEYLHRICPPDAGRQLRVLEAGCGSGKLGLSYAIRGADVVLLDVDINALRYACRLNQAYAALRGEYPHPATRLRFMLCGIHYIPYNYMRGSQDLVFNEGVPHHWTDEEHRQGAIDAMVWACKPGGHVCIIGNNGLNPGEQEEDRSTAFTYEGMPPNRICFTPAELTERMERAGLTDVTVSFLDNPVAEYSRFIGGDGIKKGNIDA